MQELDMQQVEIIKRTERMRDVLTAVVNKVKTFNISQLNTLVDQVLPRVYTNITANDIFGLLPSAPNFKNNGKFRAGHMIQKEKLWIDGMEFNYIRK